MAVACFPWIWILVLVVQAIGLVSFQWPSSNAEEIRHDDSLAETLVSSETALFSSLTIRQSEHLDP